MKLHYKLHGNHITQCNTVKSYSTALLTSLDIMAKVEPLDKIGPPLELPQEVLEEAENGQKEDETRPKS